MFIRISGTRHIYFTLIYELYESRRGKAKNRKYCYCLLVEALPIFCGVALKCWLKPEVSLIWVWFNLNSLWYGNNMCQARLVRTREMKTESHNRRLMASFRAWHPFQIHILECQSHLQFVPIHNLLLSTQKLWHIPSTIYIPTSQPLASLRCQEAHGIRCNLRLIREIYQSLARLSSIKSHQEGQTHKNKTPQA